MSSLISTTTPLGSSATWTSSIQQTTRATQITGSVFADEAGTCYIDQSGDGVNFDLSASYIVPINDGITIETDVICQYFRVRYVNGLAAQATFRLYIDLRDPYGDFLLAAQAPSAGGNWAVLFMGASGYQYVGRFNATDGWNANGNAATFLNQTGQYASAPISDFVVTEETITPTTIHTIASF